MTNTAYEATNSDVRLIARTKQLSSLMVERFSMNPISAKILREDWEKEFPDHESVAKRFNALIVALEEAQQYSKKRDEENQDLMLTIGRLRVEREQLESAPHTDGMMQLSNELAEMKHGNGLTSAASDVLGERHRQISKKGWSNSRDDNYVHRQLMWAAVTYCFSSANDRKYAERFWPWDNDWFKPTDERRDLVKAGALIIAEIERIDRSAGGTVEGD